MTRIIGHMVVKNEEHRYLEPCLRWLQNIVDILVVVDDNSSDNTFQICSDYTPHVFESRGPSFVASEWRLRQAAFERMASRITMMPEDWILCIDADEFLIDDPESIDLRGALEADIARADHHNVKSLRFDVLEVWGFDGHIPQVRVDGYWGSITAHRLVKPFGADLSFRQMDEGCGSVPEQFIKLCYPAVSTKLMHFGYARPEDRQAKYQRYSRKGTRHSTKHISSIIKQPELMPWKGRRPE